MRVNNEVLHVTKSCLILMLLVERLSQSNTSTIKCIALFCIISIVCELALRLFNE